VRRSRHPTLRRSCDLHHVAVAIIALWVSSFSLAAMMECPCETQEWCQTKTGPPVNPNGEIFGFSAWWNGPATAAVLNWTVVTTIAWAHDDETMCRAHQNGARAVMAAPAINLTELLDYDARRVWITEALAECQSTFRDGINFDYEEPQPKGSAEGQAYARLVAETRDAFHQANPSLQISVDVPWSPNDIDGRAFPYLDLADASDLLYVMDYDTRSQLFDDAGMIQGMEQWLSLGIDPKKFILGVPWYGYQYACLEGTLPDALFCPIQQVPFRGVNCSDAAGKQVDYWKALEILRKTNATLTGGLRRDANTGTLFFNDVQKGIIYQHWFDDPILLRRKYAWAREHGLAGVGPWNFQCLDPVHQPDESGAMWSAFDDFLSPPKPLSVS
jgi:Di-N-acetylchitobiase